MDRGDCAPVSHPTSSPIVYGLMEQPDAVQDMCSKARGFMRVPGFDPADYLAIQPREEPG